MKGRPGGAGRGRDETKAKAPPLPALGQVARQIDEERLKLAEGPNVVRDFWRAQDAAHGKRPDFQLWRQLRGAERFTGRPEGVVSLMGQALRSQDAQVRWAALALLPALPETARAGLESAVAAALKSPQPGGCEKSLAWVSWLAAGTQESPAALVAEQEGSAWKAGRALALQAVAAEGWLPVSSGVFRCWVAGKIEQAAPPAVWLLTAWLLRRDARPEGALRRAREANTLLDAAYGAWRDGQSVEAVRYGALALHLLPRTRPDWLMRRLRPMAWRLAEAGIRLDKGLAVDLEQLPFPGEPPLSEKGRELAAEFADEADVSRPELMREVEQGGDWEVLRAAGVALHHPLAALGWVAKKAGSHAVKKQHALLEAATRLALRHGCWGSAGRLLAVWPGCPSAVLDFTRGLRTALRRMPFFRSAVAWADLTWSLREAWGRLEEGSIKDEEALFLLHETLVDRLRTTALCLPESQRCSDDEDWQGHLQVAEQLEREPKQLSLLEHQRVVELWEISALTRERADLEAAAWVSVVLRGAMGAGHYSVMLLTRSGRSCWQGRSRGGFPAEVVVQEIKTALDALGSASAAPLLLALDPQLPPMPWEAAFPWVERLAVPSWEAAFRTLREGTLADLR